jgi:hypothetical protein
MCGLADLLCEDLGEAAGTGNGNPHHGRLSGPMLHGEEVAMASLADERRWSMRRRGLRWELLKYLMDHEDLRASDGVEEALI